MSKKTKETTDEVQEPVLLNRFELPNRLTKNEDTETDTYAQFLAEPFERGFGHTLGNSLRRVLLSSIEGAAVTSVRIAGAQHEFSTLPGVVEDVTDIILNIKRIGFKHTTKEASILTINVEKKGIITAGDIEEADGFEVVNKDQIICTLDKKVKFECELQVQVGRGFATSEENKVADAPIGVIAVETVFSPVSRVKYSVEATRVGQITNYDKLILDIWTDGRIEPNDALLQASAIMRHHLDVFVNYDDDAIAFQEAQEMKNEEDSKLKRLLNMSVNEIELSVRAANCLNNANIITVGQLATKTEADMLKYRNFGKKSLNEIKDKLIELGLGLGMSIDPDLIASAITTTTSQFIEEEESPVGLSDLIAQNIED